jgi:hypothetical protein
VSAPRLKGVVMGRKPKLTHRQRQEAVARREAWKALVDIGRYYAGTITSPTARSAGYSECAVPYRVQATLKDGTSGVVVETAKEALEKIAGLLASVTPRSS